MTENSGPGASLHDDEVWASSDHCPLWCEAEVELEGADLDLSQLPWRPTLPRADWPFATAEDRAEIPSRIEKAQKEAFEALASTGLARWGGHLNQALRAFADIWVGVETAVVLSCIGRANPEPPRDSSWLRRESKAFGRVNGPLP